MLSAFGYSPEPPPVAVRSMVCVAHDGTAAGCSAPGREWTRKHGTLRPRSCQHLCHQCRQAEAHQLWQSFPHSMESRRPNCRLASAQQGTLCLAFRQEPERDNSVRMVRQKRRAIKPIRSPIIFSVISKRDHCRQTAYVISFHTLTSLNDAADMLWLLQVCSAMPINTISRPPS